MRSWLWKMKSLSGRDWFLSGLWTVWNDRHQPGRKWPWGWEKFQEQPADILLTDINMPQMNGLDLAHLVKEQSPSCHIIFLTGYDDFEFARKAIKLGADDYLLKPFSKDDIEEMLAKVKGKLDKERKKAQVEEFGQPWLFDRVGRSHSCSFSRFAVNPEGFGLSTWLQFLLSKCIDQEKIGTSFPRIPHPRANEEGSTLASHDRFKDLWDCRSGWFWRYELFFSTL